MTEEKKLLHDRLMAEKQREKRRKYYEKNKERIKERCRIYAKKRYYSLKNHDNT
jgi:hypothetical protein